MQAKTLRKGEIDLFNGLKVEAFILHMADLDVRLAKEVLDIFSCWHL